MTGGPGFPFDRLIAPVSRGAFLGDYYEAAPLVLHRNDKAYYDELLTPDQVWEQVERGSLRRDDLKMVKFGGDQVSDDYMGPEGRADPVRVASMFGDGWTIALSKMQERMPALLGLCTAAEAVFSAPFQTNLYYTPAHAQGFIPHWDTHDVFVLQVYGAKEWVLYDTPIELPLVGQSFDTHKPPPGPVSQTFTLRAGDLLYCPRGLMHAAHSGPDESLHITLGLLAKTWSDLVLEAVSKAVLDDPAFRRNLPAGYAQHGFDRAPAERVLRDLMDRLATTALGPAMDQMRSQFTTTRRMRRPGHAGQLARLDTVAPETVVAVRADLVWHIVPAGEEIELVCAGSTLTLPGFTQAAVEHAMTAPRFVIDDLPGPLDPPGKLVLVRRLIAEGLLHAVHD